MCRDREDLSLPCAANTKFALSSQRGLVGEIITRFERKGFQLKALKLYQTPREVAEEHYKDLKSKPFYKVTSRRPLRSHFPASLHFSPSRGPLHPGAPAVQDTLRRHRSPYWGMPTPLTPCFHASPQDLVDYILSGPVVCMVWGGDGVVKSARTLIGATNPLESAPGTIRGDFAVEVGRNVIHGSDSDENGVRETALWFEEGEVISWTPTMTPWLREEGRN